MEMFIFLVKLANTREKFKFLGLFLSPQSLAFSDSLEEFRPNTKITKRSFLLEMGERWRGSRRWGFWTSSSKQSNTILQATGLSDDILRIWHLSTLAAAIPNLIQIHLQHHYNLNKASSNDIFSSIWSFIVSGLLPKQHWKGIFAPWKDWENHLRLSKLLDEQSAPSTGMENQPKQFLKFDVCL